MEDISQVFLMGYYALHKTNSTQQSLQGRKEVTNQLRKEKRCTAAFENRKIDVNMSPVTPVLQRKEIQTVMENGQHENKPSTGEQKVVDAAKPAAHSRRWEMLVQWKQEKLKKKAENASKKPVFKVCHVSKPIGSDIGTANKFIKGKPIPAPPTNRFNVSSNHQFKFKLNTPQIDNKSTTKANTLPAASTSRIHVALNPPTKMSRIKLYTPQVNNPIPKAPTTQQNTKKCKREQSSKKENPVKDITKPKTVNNKTINNKQNVENIQQKTQLQKSNTLNKKPNNILKEDNQRKETKSTKSNIRTVHKNDKVNNVNKLYNNELVMKLAKCNLQENVVQKEMGQEVIVPEENKNDTLNKINDIGITEKELVIRIQNCQIQESTVSSTNPTVTPRRSCRLRKNNLEVCKGFKSSVSDNPSQNATKTPTQKSNTVPSSGISNSVESNHNDDASNHEEDSKESDVMYLSPFVTSARGKEASRNEYKIRQQLARGSVIVGTPELARVSLNLITPKAGAAYFTCKLDEEVSRLERLCDEWETYRNDPDVPNDAHDSIDATVGQTRLLLTKKFRQFRSLIDRCRTQSENDDDKPVTCEDLHGFWDMMYMQVENLDERFKNLNRLRDNRWEEFLQKAAPVVVKRGRGRPKKATTTKNASSKLKEAIKAARQKKVEEERVFEGGFFTVRSPDVRNTPNKCDHHSTSVRRSRLLLETRKSDHSSPSLVMFNMSTAIKSGNGLTPSKSILKSAGKSSMKSKKSVVFSEDETKLLRTKLFFD